MCNGTPCAIRGQGCGKRPGIYAAGPTGLLSLTAYHKDSEACVGTIYKSLCPYKQEHNALHKAMDSPEFLKAFKDYAEDLADPKVRLILINRELGRQYANTNNRIRTPPPIVQTKAEMDAYLRQLEAAGQIQEVCGSDMEVIIPEPWFVLKTRTAVDATKVFVNICTSARVSTPCGGPSANYSKCCTQKLTLPP